MRDAIAGLSRFIVTPDVAKHRLFAWVKPPIVADKNRIVIAREDDTTFGILHSRFHELWSLRMGSWTGKGNDPRYTSSTTFAIFSFPSGFIPNISLDDGSNPGESAIAIAAKNLNGLREAWLNPHEWVDVTPEVVPGYPDRIIPKPEYAKAIKERTLTNLYNQRPHGSRMCTRRSMRPSPKPTGGMTTRAR